MKAVLVRTPGGPEVLDYVDVERPQVGDNDVLIRTENFGVGQPDVLIRSPLPANPGNDAAGRIAAVGRNVRGFAVGQKVLLTARDLPRRGGCYAELIAVPADVPYALSENVNLESAVCLANYQVAHALLHEASGKHPVRSVLIVGAAGGVGSALVELARLAGMTAIGSVSSEEKATFARAMGAAAVIYYRKEDVIARTRELTGGRGVDLILDHVCGPDFADYFGALGPWGTMVSYNAFSGLPEKDLIGEMRKYLDICPSVRCFSFHIYDHDREGRRALMRAVIAHLAAGEIKPAIAARFKLSEVRKAHAYLESGAALGKVIMTV